MRKYQGGWLFVLEIALVSFATAAGVQAHYYTMGGFAVPSFVLFLLIGDEYFFS